MRHPILTPKYLKKLNQYRIISIDRLKVFISRLCCQYMMLINLNEHEKVNELWSFRVSVHVYNFIQV